MSQVAFRYGLIAMVLFASVVVRAQQQPMYTQYMFNGLVLNPAYAGAKETFTATAMMRNQWVGIEGAPKTQTFSAHSPLDDLRRNRRPGSPVSLGFILFNDQIAITGQTGILASYAYRIRFQNTGSLSLGLQGGFSQLRVRYSKLELDDPSFAGGDLTRWQPDFGAGIYYQSARFFAGISAPQMLRSKLDVDRSSIAMAPHYFLSAGYVFDVKPGVKLKPSALIKNFGGDLFQLDLNCNVFLKETLNLGLSWRLFESVGTMIQFQVHTRFAIGYAYDIPYGSEVATLSSGSHEIMVNYKLPKKEIRTINPRFF